MKVKERKAQIKKITFLARETQKDIKQHSERFNKVRKLAVAFHETLEDDEFDHLFELDEFKESHLNQLLDRVLNDLYHAMFNLRNDLDDIVSEATDNELNKALHLVDQGISEYETLEEAIEGIEKFIKILNQIS